MRVQDWINSLVSGTSVSVLKAHPVDGHAPSWGRRAGSGRAGYRPVLEASGHGRSAVRVPSPASRRDWEGGVVG